MKTKNFLKNERGIAIVETIPMLIVFVVLLAYGIGFFGVIHTATLNTISARAYIFETFRNRADLRYFREVAGTTVMHEYGSRVSGVKSEKAMDSRAQEATDRPIAIGLSSTSEKKGDVAFHNEEIFRGIAQFESPSIKRNQSLGVSPVWIMSQYGMCLNSKCGD